MELKSTVVTLNNLLKLNFEDEFSSFIMPTKTKLSIPDYQREYKWEKAKIKTFVDNVMNRSKFLGIITTEVSREDDLSIVDGQQRLTTIMLMLVQLYNSCADEGETETQSEIQDLISSQNDGLPYFKLVNESVGEYLHFFTDDNGHNKIKIEIDSNNDIYKQEQKFKEACIIIQTAFNHRDENITLDIYKQRLVDCEMLLFAQKNTTNMQQGSTEEIYIDINEKAQRLDPEDIFKGHCFAICKTGEQQNQVKCLWRTTKQQFFNMNDIFKNADMGTFLHFFLLTQEAMRDIRKDIKKDLTIDGENIIVCRYNTPTKAINLLKNLKDYQSNLTEFTNDLKIMDYNFSHIMNTTPQILGNKTDQLKEMGIILQDIIHCNQNLFKLPLYFLIDQNFRKESADKLSYEQFSRFTYLYYIYMFLFSRIGGSRKRGDLPSKLIYKINSGQDYLIQFIKEIINYSQDFILDNKSIGNDITRKQLYNILDGFKINPIDSLASQDSDINLSLRLFPATYNLEHLIVNQSRSILWHSSDETEYEFSNDDFSSCDAWNRQQNKWSNYIWIDKDFNRDELKNKDIISKIKLLRGNTYAGNPPTDNTYAKKHYCIETICQHIMKTNGFSDLMTAYSNNASRADVLHYYKIFIEEYFNDENMDGLRAEFEMQFKKMLDSLKALIQ